MKVIAGAQLGGGEIARHAIQAAQAASIAACAAATAFIAPATQAQTPGRAEVVASGLDHPWALAFIGDSRMLVTERSGAMRVIAKDGKPGEPVAGLPKIDVGGQGGLHDVITDRDFARNRIIYFCYAEPASGGGSGNSTALASARLSDDTRRLEQVRVLFSQQPKVDSSAHFGCRIVEQDNDTLFLTLGDRYERMQDAQTLDNHNGKIVRLRKDGGIPADNPHAGKQTAGTDATQQNKSNGKVSALPAIWSIGHRNLQGAALGPEGKLWTHEHGPQGGDELNRPEAGKNYGWPVITYGENYGGGAIGAGLTEKSGMEQPLHYWKPSIAPSGMTFLRSDRYGKAWQGSLFIGSLKFRYLARLELKEGKVLREEKLLQGVGRVRDVREGPDGLLYLLTDDDNGKLIRVLPAA